MRFAYGVEPLPLYFSKINERIREQTTGSRANGFDETMRRKNETFALDNSLGLSIHPTKGYNTAT